MPRMIELIRKSSVSATLMQAAARGALSVPPTEILEILVHLATHNKVFGEQARLTLAGWDENACRTAASDPNTPQEVLSYFADPHNARPPLIPCLLDNPAVTHEMLLAIAQKGPREAAEMMSTHPRVTASPELMHALKSNPNVIWNELAGREQRPAAVPQSAPPPAAEIKAEPASGETVAEDDAVNSFLAEHANELSAEQAKPFQAIGGTAEDLMGTSEAPAVTAPAAAVTAGAAAAAVAPQKILPKKGHVNPEDERGSALQKISRLDVKGRIQLAMKGTKEERSLLVRDGTKLVAIAVLESPKISDGEVEKIACQKNVLEAVLRAIPMKRRFAKNYIIMRNLVFNPRTPMDVSLGLMKGLLVGDLRNLSGNKEVSETVRKLALRMFKQKAEDNKK